MADRGVPSTAMSPREKILSRRVINSIHEDTAAIMSRKEKQRVEVWEQKQLGQNKAPQAMKLRYRGAQAPKLRGAPRHQGWVANVTAVPAIPHPLIVSVHG